MSPFTGPEQRKQRANPQQFGSTNTSEGVPVKTNERKIIYLNKSLSHWFGENVKSNLNGVTVQRKNLLLLQWATFGTPRDMALTHKRLLLPRTHSLLTGICILLLRQNKKATWFCCIFCCIAQFFFCLCHGTIWAWKNRIDKLRKKGLALRTLALAVLLQSYLARSALLLDNESAKTNRQSVQTKRWTSGNSCLEKKNTISILIKSPVRLEPPFNDIWTEDICMLGRSPQLIKYISGEIWSLYIHICPDGYKSSIWSSSHARRKPGVTGQGRDPCPARRAGLLHSLRTRYTGERQP